MAVYGWGHTEAWSLPFFFPRIVPVLKKTSIPRFMDTPFEAHALVEDDAGSLSHTNDAVKSGMLAFRNGEVLKAVQLFDDAISSQPSLFNGCWQRGLALFYVDTVDSLGLAAVQFSNDVAYNGSDGEETIWFILSEARRRVKAGSTHSEAVEAAVASAPSVGSDPRKVIHAAQQLFQATDSCNRLQLFANLESIGHLHNGVAESFTERTREMQHDAFYALLSVAPAQAFRKLSFLISVGL